MVRGVIDESKAARQLGSVLEPVTGQVYFSPECHANYVALGFAPSNGEFNGVAAPDGPAYFTSRGSVLGQVPGTVVAATFGVFNPEAVVPGRQDSLHDPLYVHGPDHSGRRGGLVSGPVGPSIGRSCRHPRSLLERSRAGKEDERAVAQTTTTMQQRYDRATAHLDPPI